VAPVRDRPRGAQEAGARADRCRRCRARRRGGPAGHGGGVPRGQGSRDRGPLGAGRAGARCQRPAAGAVGGGGGGGVISTPAQKLSFYRNRIPLFLGLLALPWLWAATIVPWWVTAVGLTMVPVFAFIMIVVVFPSPPASRRASDGPQLSNEQIGKMREASTGLYNLLGRWSTVSRDTRASLEKVQAQVDDVMMQTEKSVIDVTNSFLAITRKTHSQMELALGLLQQARV